MTLFVKALLPAPTILLALLFVSAAADYDWPKVNTTEERPKVFTVKQHFRYVQRMYQPPVPVALVTTEPQYIASAEEVLRSQLSAMKALNFEWWLRTWDQASQAKIKFRLLTSGRTKEELLLGWKHDFSGSAGVVLVRWILTGNYVLVSYGFLGRQQNVQSREIAVAFRLENGPWKASLDLEEDPVFLHFGDEKQVFERTVRD